jgi:hypothetical protein
MARPVPLAVALLVSAMLLTTAVALAVTSLALSADGSYYLVQVLQTEHLYGPSSRMFVEAVREAPILLAVRVGVVNTHVLSLVEGVGQLVFPAIVWSLAIVLSRRRPDAFAAVSMTAGLCAATTWFFSANESVLAIPLTVLVAVLLWQPVEWRTGPAALAVATCIVLIASYETAALTGAVLALWAAWRSVSAHAHVDRYGSALVALLSTASVAVALNGSRTGQNSTHSQSLIYYVVSLVPWSLYLGLAGIVATVAAATLELGRPARRSVLVTGIGCCSIAVIGLEASPLTAFEARGGAALATFLLLLFLLWRWQATARRARVSDEAGVVAGWPRILPPAFVAAILIASLTSLAAWTRSLDAFRAEVDRQTGTAFVDDVLPSDRRQAVWPWTSSSLSLVLRSDPNAGVLVDRDPSWVPFPPESAGAQLRDEYTWGG